MILLTKVWKDGYGKEMSETIVVNPLHILTVEKALCCSSERAKSFVRIADSSTLVVDEDVESIFSKCQKDK